MKKILAVMFSLVLVASVATQVQAQPRSVILNDGPLVYYAFEETSGTTAVDSSGNGFDGTYVNATLGATGAFGGNAVTLGDGASAYIAVPDLDVCADAYTIEIILTDFVATEEFGSLYSTNECDDAACVHWNITPGNNGAELAGIGNEVIANSGVPAPGEVTEPVHIAFVVDGINGVASVYVGGVKVDDVDIIAIGADCDSFIDAAIGAWLVPDASAERFVAGTIDDFAIFDSALSEQRIQAHAFNIEPVISVDQSATEEISESHPTNPTSTTFSVSLIGGNPNINLEVLVDPNTPGDDGSDVDLGQGAGNSQVLTFTPTDWHLPQNVTVAAVNDGDPEDCKETVGFVISVIDPNNGSLEPNYQAPNLTGSAQVIVIDNDTGCTFVEGEGIEIEEADPIGTAGSITYVLNRAPAGGDNVISLTETSTLATISPDSLTFTGTNWHTPQTVTITAVSDGIFNDAEPTVTGQSSGDVTPADPNAFNPVATVEVTLIEDECGELPFLSSDFNADCVVNLLDFSLFSGEWGACSHSDGVSCP